MNWLNSSQVVVGLVIMTVGLSVTFGFIMGAIFQRNWGRNKNKPLREWTFH